MTIRVCDLKRGDKFKYWGYCFKVVKVDDRIRYRAVDQYGGELDSFSLHSQMLVELMPVTQRGQHIPNGKPPDPMET